MLLNDDLFCNEDFWNDLTPSSSSELFEKASEKQDVLSSEAEYHSSMKTAMDQAYKEYFHCNDNLY